MPKPFGGHTGRIWAVAYSPDGRLIATGSGDETIRVWDALTGAEVMEPWKGHAGEVNTISFSLDGRKLVSGGDDQMLRVWDVSTGECILGPLTGHKALVWTVVFSPNGRLIASGAAIRSENGPLLLLWSSDTGEMIKEIPGYSSSESIRALSFSPDGTRLASGSSDNCIRVYDVESWSLILGPLEGHTRSVCSVDFSPDGRRLVSGSRDQSLRIWDSETGETVVGPLQGHSDWVECVQFSPDGEKVVSGACDATLRVWNSLTGELLVGPLGHDEVVWTVTFSPDGTRIASGGGDRTVRIWNAESGKAILPAIFPTESSSSLGNAYSGLIYSHLFSHTMRLVKRHQPSQAHSLHANYLGWTAHSNEIAQFINHRIIYLSLHEYLAQISLKNQNSENLRSLDDITKDDRNQIAARISKMLQTQRLRKVLFEQRGPQAQSLLDLLQELLDNLTLPDTRPHLVTVLVRLSRESGLYPERLLLKDVQIEGRFPLAGGSYGDVWKGSVDSRAVAVKMMRTYHTQDERLFKTFAKEAVLWAQLSNPYVLPLLGVYCIFEPIRRVCLVSPWMDNRNLSQYLEEHPETNRLSLILDIALGLDYLHSFEPPVIHGDLKGANILITAERRACVADFGLCILVQTAKIQCTTSSRAHRAGTVHWMAPELFEVEDRPESIRKTCSSDVYAFGCVCFEIYDGKAPFSQLNGLQVVLAIKENRPRPRPIHFSLEDSIWTLIQQCLVTDPRARPNMKQIIQKLERHPDVQYHRTPSSWGLPGSNDPVRQDKARTKFRLSTLRRYIRDLLTPDSQ